MAYDAHSVIASEAKPFSLQIKHLWIAESLSALGFTSQARDFACHHPQQSTHQKPVTMGCKSFLKRSCTLSAG
jgi:hypothetical protein